MLRLDPETTACFGDCSELWADMADVEEGGGKDGGVGVGSQGEGGGAEGSAALSSLSRDDPVAPKAPLQLQVLQLLPQLLPLLLLLLLTGTKRWRTRVKSVFETLQPGSKHLDPTSLRGLVLFPPVDQSEVCLLPTQVKHECNHDKRLDDSSCIHFFKWS